MSKKIVALLMVVMLVSTMLVGCAGTEDTVTMGMITDTGGLGDQSFNDSAWAGLTRAQEELGIEAKVLQSETADDYFPNLATLAEEQAELIIGVGFLFEEAMVQAAEKFPEQKFAIVDAGIEGYDNIASITFAEHEGSFLVGVIAGLTTETDTIGFIGGMKFPLIEKFEYGFRAGVQAVNPDAEVIVNYADSFDDAGKGKEIATVQHQKGADVIFHAAGGVGVGLIQAAEEQGFWAIGVDQDQSALSPEHVLASMVKRVDNAVFAVAETVTDGTYHGGINYFDLAAGGVGYSDNAGNTPDDVKAVADAYAEAIAAGDFAVPATQAEFDAFEAPQM